MATINGGNSDDSITGSSGADTINAGDGNDVVVAGDGHDSVRGGGGSDTLHGGGGNDSLYGEDGDDHADGGAGNDVIDGGSGNDRLDGGDNADTLQGGDGDDTIFGGAGDDVIVGGSGRNRLDGGDGDDSIHGGDEDDHISGGAGNDSIVAGHGNNYVDGGAGDDRIEFNGYGGGNSTVAFGPGGGSDTVIGFGPTEDFIDLPDGLTSDDLIFTQSDDPRIWTITFAGGDPADRLTLDFTHYWDGDVTERQLRSRVLDQPEAAGTVPACFTPGCRVMTVQGQCRIETLVPGTRIPTRDGDVLPLVALLETRVTPEQVAHAPDLRPVVLPRGCLGPGLPARRMRLSPQHGLLLRAPNGEALIRARHVVELARLGHRQDAPNTVIRYLHLLLPRHAIVSVDGIWSESFLPGGVTEVAGQADRLLHRARSGGTSIVIDRCRPLLPRRTLRGLSPDRLRAALLETGAGLPA